MTQETSWSDVGSTTLGAREKQPLPRFDTRCKESLALRPRFLVGSHAGQGLKMETRMHAIVEYLGVWPDDVIGNARFFSNS